MGTVYRARHMLMDRAVAIKVLHPRFVENEGARTRFQLEARAAVLLHHANAVSVTDFGQTPEGLVLTEEIRTTVNSAIDELPEDLRTAIMLRELEGLSYEEIAASMDCPVGTVRSRIFRAREAIDRRLREVFEGGLGRAEEELG